MRLSSLKDVLRAYGDGNLFGEPYGEGPVQVVWLHGWARRGHDFAESARQLASEGVASIAFDLPGFGSSPLPSVAGGARMYAQLLAPVFAELSDGPLVLVGHSFGGTIATVIAAERPQLVRALVLVGSPVLRGTSGATPARRFRAIRWLHRKGLVGDQAMESARQRFGSADYRNANGRLREILVASVQESLEDELRRVQAPVVMVWGARDLEVPLDVARRAATLLTTPSTLHVLDDVGHLVPTSDPNAIVSAVREALA